MSCLNLLPNVIAIYPLEVSAKLGAEDYSVKNEDLTQLSPTASSISTG